jgi:hypothetical protein
MSVLILEDDPDRMARFIIAVAQIDKEMKVTVWRSAKKMISEIGPHLATAKLISLDHDLLPSKREDSGSGLDAAKYLAAQQFDCPIIIHTSNAGGARKMAEALSGRNVKTISPLGTDWIEDHWVRTAKSLLAK